MSTFDFNSLNRPSIGAKPVDPIEVFRSASSLESTPNDLWRGQSQALESWHSERETNDILVSLHTGAGKSLVGIIIAQSLINEGVQNVIYACATNDLVTQTESECRSKLGFDCTTRMGGKFSNELFENGTAFCITNYQALFNSRTIFRGDVRPGAIIFDDAHVAEKVIRDCYTISLRRRGNETAYREFVNLAAPFFEQIMRREFLAAIVKGTSTYSCTAVPPNAVVTLSQSGALSDWIDKHQLSHEFALGHLADKMGACSIFIARDGIEIAPAFLPSKRIDFLASKEVRRIYLSATLSSEIDFCRAFGKRPAKKVEPENDAGVGERLIILRRRDQLVLNGQKNPDFSAIAGEIADQQKVLIASSSYSSAKKYDSLTKPPQAKEFSSALDAFRSSTSPGAFSLVARVDGIDLPHGTCRVSIIDGLPTGFSLCERFQFDSLEMRNSFASRIANRIVQLFGRTNRGRNDYSVIFSFDDKVISWLNKNRNLALLPPLLQSQIELGRSLVDQFKINDVKSLPSLADQVLKRDPAWLRFYKDTIGASRLSEEDKQQARDTDEALLKGAEAEAEFAAQMWDGRPELAREKLGEAIHSVAPADRRLAGWYSMHIGHTFELEGDSETAKKHYADARSRTFFDIALPLPSTARSVMKDVVAQNAFHEQLIQLFASDKTVARNPWDKFNSQINALLSEKASSNQHEEAMRLLGEILGFDSSRPEQESDEESTLDVLWIAKDKSFAFLWSLKTKKDEGSPLNGEEIGTGHLHLEWFRKAYPGVRHELFFLAPTAECVSTAHPSEDMKVVNLSSIRDFYRSLDQAMINLFRLPPAERISECAAMSGRHEWQTDGIRETFEAATVKRLTSS